MNRQLATLSELQVAVRSKTGGIAYDAVYAFGHVDSRPVTEFVKLTTSSASANQSLVLSPGHYLPISAGELPRD